MAFGAIGGQGTGQSRGSDIVVDGAGNSFISSYFKGTVDFDPGPGTFALASTTEHHFLAKYDAAGHLAWALTSNAPEPSFGSGVAVDAWGSSYLVGSFGGTVDFDPGPATAELASADMAFFLAKYDPAAGLEWVSTVGSGNPTPREVAVDGTGSSYVAGYLNGTVDFDPGPGTVQVASSYSSPFLAKYDSAGSILWATGIGPVFNPTYAEQLAIDDAGNSYIAGIFNGTVDFDPGAGTAELVATSFIHFVAKFDAAGSFQWVAAPGSASDSQTDSGIAIDGSGNVYVTGDFAGTADFDPGIGTAQYETDDGAFYIVKYDAGGAFVWARSSDEGAGSNDSYGIAVDAAGNSYITGAFRGSVDFDPGPGTAALVTAGQSAYIAKYDPDGELIWVREPAVAPDYLYPEAITLDGGGNLLVTGQFKGTVDFDAGTATLSISSADYKHFILTYTPSGELNLDLTPPDRPTVDGIADDTGDPDDGATTDRTLVVSGTAEALSTVHVLRDGGEIDTVRADGDGEWTWTDPATLAAGAHTYAAFAEDALGNEGGLSDILDVFVIDGQASVGNGNDLVASGPGGGSIDGKNGNDTIFGEGGRDTLKGGNGNDFLSGGSDRDAVWGGNGNDTLSGGGDGDTLYGEGGNDRLDGDDGGDRMEGGAGSDYLDGGAGADTLSGGDGTDTLVGGSGADRLSGDALGDWIVLEPDGARDTVFGAIAHLTDDTLVGFETGAGGDVLAITGLSAKNGKLLDSVAITDGVLSLSKFGGGAITFEGLEGAYHTDTMLGGDGSILVYVM